ncbi:MAG: hypothetical protein ACI4HI_02300 [Lachnospiraceae bacterium]
METTRKVKEILREKLWIARPLKVMKQENDQIRLNMVTDDIGPKSLFGGVATSLILATMLCEKNDWTLRIITRWAECNLKDYYRFAEIYGIKPAQKVEAYSDEEYDSETIHDRLPVSDHDIFMATSWWSAKSILESNVCDRLIYIIQEEETFFYPYSDERLWCEQIMNSDKIDFIVNSKLLYDYMEANGYDMLVKNAMYFEPAFSKKLYSADENSFKKDKNEKRKMFFYGRPKNQRNLYYFGLECLDEALSRGVIDTDIWDIYMAGYETEAIKFSNGYIPKMNGVMAWDEYAKFAKTVDVSFSLMYTPHPSYPPFDMLCSGAVVLTNEFKNKKDLQYSKNMILKKLEKEALIDGLSEAMNLALDTKKRESNYQCNNINTDWSVSFKEIVSVLEERIKEGRYV